VGKVCGVAVWTVLSSPLSSFSPIPFPGLLWQITKIQLPLYQIFVKNHPELVALLQEAEDMTRLLKLLPEDSLLLLRWFNNHLTRSGTTHLVNNFGNELKVSLSSLPFCGGNILWKDTKLLLAAIWLSVLTQFATQDHDGTEGHVIAGAHRKATSCARTFSMGNLKDQSLKNEWYAMNWKLLMMAGEIDEEYKEPKFPSTGTQPNQPTSISVMATSSTANSTQATTPPPPLSCALLYCFSCCRSVVVMSFLFVMLMTSLPLIHATRSSDHQHHDPSPSPVPTISSSTTCSNGLEDGNYLFRSYSEQSWSFCGVSGAGYRELSFQISGCECYAGLDREVCADTTTFSSLAPASVPPSIPHHLSGLHCSADDYSISTTDTCLLITLSDQYGDGWTSGDGSSENAWFGYSFTSSNGDSSAITYHSLNCSCPRMIGCLSPSSFAAEDQTIDLAIYSNEDSAVAFSWEIMYLVQVIQNGRLLDSHHGGYRTHMVFSYSHSLGTLSLSSKTNGFPGNGDAVDMLKCQELPVVGLVSDLFLESWSIVDSNSNKQETIAWRNPSCAHTLQTSLVPLDTLPMLPGASASSVPHLPVAQSKSFVEFPHQPQDSFSSPTVPASSRHLVGELGEVGSVMSLAGAGSSGSTNGVGTIARFNAPLGVSISPDGAYALVADYYNHLIRHIVISTASVTTLVGAGSSGSTNGVGTIARFNAPVGVSISPDGYALVADQYSHLIRHIAISAASVTTLVGAGSSGSTNGVGTIARFNLPIGVSISPDGVYALVADYYNHLIRHIVISTASVTTLVGAGSSGSTNGVGTIARFNLPVGVSISPDGVYALVADHYNHLVRHIVISTASVTTLVGAGSSGSTNGVGTIARFNYPVGVSISPDGYALVADRSNHLVRHIVISTASVTTLAGVAGSSGSTNGVGTIARFNFPYGVSISPNGVYALVTEWNNHLIRQIVISTATPSVFPSPAPSFSTSLPSVPRITRFSFGVKIGDEGILSPGKAILVDYLQDVRRGQILPTVIV
jgi:DNA-binding beta-propeller fold protein YncE